MKTFCSILIGSCFPLALFSQVFYNVTFNAGFFPVGWTPSDSRVMVINNTPSSGYSSSPTSPEASGEENVIFQHCAPPNGSTIMLDVAGVISTVGKTNIRVGFGRRATGGWDRPMTLEWSSDGMSWNLIDSDVSAGASTTWGSTYYDLPADADNVANLRFRFTFTIATNQNCTAPPNFRIDDFTVGANFSLPVELSRFEARLVDQQVQLIWTTLAEKNNAYFAVEHSIDGTDFKEIGTVVGAGTATARHDYVFWHKSPAPGANYYRIRQSDYNGLATYSVLRSVLINQPQEYRIFPNPVSEYIKLQLTNLPEVAPIELTIFDALGRQIKADQIAVGSSEINISLVGIPAGNYILQVAGNQWVRTKKIVIQ